MLEFVTAPMIWMFCCLVLQMSLESRRANVKWIWSVRPMLQLHFFARSDTIHKQISEVKPHPGALRYQAELFKPFFHAYAKFCEFLTLRPRKEWFVYGKKNKNNRTSLYSTAWCVTIPAQRLKEYSYFYSTSNSHSNSESGSPWKNIYGPWGRRATTVSVDTTTRGERGRRGGVWWAGPPWWRPVSWMMSLMRETSLLHMRPTGLTLQIWISQWGQMHEACRGEFGAALAHLLQLVFTEMQSKNERKRFPWRGCLIQRQEGALLLSGGVSADAKPQKLCQVILKGKGCRLRFKPQLPTRDLAWASLAPSATLLQNMNWRSIS